MTTPEISSFNFSDFNGLETLKSKAKQPDDETLRVAAQQLEAVFLNMVFKSMREANKSFESEMFNDDSTNFYRDFYDQQLSLTLANSKGIGLTEVIVQQLKPMIAERELGLGKAPTEDVKTIPFSLIDKNILEQRLHNPSTIDPDSKDQG